MERGIYKGLALNGGLWSRPGSSMDFKLLIHQHSDFVLQFFHTIASTDQNAALSPISISITLAMAAAGAQGLTLQQIASCLRLPSDASLHDFCSQLKTVVLADASPSGGPLLSLVNGAWVERTLPLKPSFQGVVEQKYGAAARSADFVQNEETVRVEVNMWVKDETKGKIEEILPHGALNQQSKLILANALYFKGGWQKKFDASDVVDGTFYLLNGETVSVPMMSTKKKQEIHIIDSFKVLRLPYSNGDDGRSFSMYIVLPNERTGLAELEKSFTIDVLEQHLVKKREVDVGSFKLPRFKVSAGYELSDVFSKVGLVLPFSDQADFSGMAELRAGQTLSISNIFHKTFVEVNEEGTEAAAATAVVIALRSIRFEQPIDFIADHPFLFVIREDKTGVVIFMGHVVNPLS